MRNRKLLIVLALVSSLLLIAACTKTITPEGTLGGMYQIYNDQYEDYQRMAADPATTEAQKEVMRKKKPILDELGKLLPAYDAATMNGTATRTQRETITDLLNQLGQL